MQHQDKIVQRDVYAILAAAVASQAAAIPNRAAEAFLVKLIEEGATELTFNRRDGQDRPWRDYQQILPELGLMVSTKVSRRPELTSLGLMFFDRLVAFNELVTTQVLRYQYPNGHKTDVQAGLKAEFLAARRPVPYSRTHADADAGVLLRPGTLVLRLLFELQRLGRRPQLTASDLSRLVAYRRNSDWPEALTAILAGGGRELGARRNAQDWIKLLSKAELFEAVEVGGEDAITLSAVAAGSDQIEALLKTLEDEATFWIPDLTIELRAMRRSWYDFFGTPRLEEMWAQRGTSSETVSATEDSDRGIVEIVLRDFEQFVGVTNVQVSSVDIAATLLGRQRQAESTVLHDRIVVQLAGRLKALGYDVSFDPDSVDVWARRAEVNAILEVKTLNPRNAVGRLRLGTGQLVEYRRRAETQFNITPLCLLVVGVPALPRYLNHWPDVLHAGAQIGFVGYQSGEFVPHTPGAVEQQLPI